MEFAVLGDPGDGPTLQLDHERFAYAGKFVTGRTGKAVACEDGSVVAAASFDRDRTGPRTARVRYVTVRLDRRGEGVGARLLAFLGNRLLADADRAVIAVNNPFAYEAAYKAGFCYTGETTGVAEVVLGSPGDSSVVRYRAGMAALAGRDDLSDAERAFVAERLVARPPARVVAPTGA